MAKMEDEISALSEEKRIEIKTRAKLIKDAVYDREPSLCCQPYDDKLNTILMTAVYDNPTSSESLLDAVDMFSGLADRIGGWVITNTPNLTDEKFADYRQQEDNYRKIANIIQAIFDDGFDFKEKLTAKI